MIQWQNEQNIQEQLDMDQNELQQYLKHYANIQWKWAIDL